MSCNARLNAIYAELECLSDDMTTHRARAATFRLLDHRVAEVQLRFILQFARHVTGVVVVIHPPAGMNVGTNNTQTGTTYAYFLSRLISEWVNFWPSAMRSFPFLQHLAFAVDNYYDILTLLADHPWLQDSITPQLIYHRFACRRSWLYPFEDVAGEDWIGINPSSMRATGESPQSWRQILDSG